MALEAEITLEERAKFFDAMQAIIQTGIVNTRMPWLPDWNRAPTIWHYTTGDTLIRILKSGTIWTTQVACLNDRNEVQLASDRFRDAMKRAGANVPKGDPASVVIHIGSHKHMEDEAATSPWFVACFSERENDLSQWRAYGSGEGGYALGFDMRELYWYAERNGARLYPVVYDRQNQMRIADEVVFVILKFFRDGLDKRPGVPVDSFLALFGSMVEPMIAELGPLAKDDSFNAEAEWRLIRQLRVEDVPQLEYQQRRQMISRHYPLRLHAPQSRTDVPRPRPGESPMPGVVMPALRRVIVGPSPFKERSRISVGDLLATAGYPPGQVRVSVSEIPYQSP